MKKCDLCGAVERTKDMGMINVTIGRVATAGHPDNPQSADVCHRCMAKPISELNRVFWRADLAEDDQALDA